MSFTSYSSAHAVTNSLTRLEVATLCAFAFVLPIFEAPKNLLWIAYLTLWGVNHWRSKSFGGHWQAWDSLLVAWMCSGYVSASFSGIHHLEWISAFDTFRFGSLLWMMRRSRYSAADLNKVLAFAVMGTLAALLWGYYGLNVSGVRRTLGLNSVGHVNHSAIYLVIAFGAVLAWVRASWITDRAVARLGGIVLCATFVLSLVVMASGAALGAALIVGLFILGIYASSTNRRIWPLLASALLIVAVIFATGPEVVQKNLVRLSEDRILAARDGIWRAALVAARQFPMFGVGAGNYGRIDTARLEQWSQEHGERLDTNRIWLSSHAHSLYLNTLVERGAIGLAVLVAVLSAWGFALVREIPRATQSATFWAYWGGAATAWLVAVIVGLVNTTLHHEHALLSMLWLGGWMSLRVNQAPARQNGT